MSCNKKRNALRRAVFVALLAAVLVNGDVAAADLLELRLGDLEEVLPLKEDAVAGGPGRRRRRSG